MKILKDTILFGLFASYADGIRNGAEKLPSAYNDFAMLLATLPGQVYAHNCAGCSIRK